jgi:hypothetical protein
LVGSLNVDKFCPELASKNLGSDYVTAGVLYGLLSRTYCVLGGLRVLLGVGTLGDDLGVGTFGVAVFLVSLVGHVWRLG